VTTASRRILGMIAATIATAAASLLGAAPRAALASTLEPVKAMCLLAFEREEHPISQRLLSEFGSRPDVDVFVEATPSDFFRCMKGQYRQITFVAHSVSMDEYDNGVNLGFFKRLAGPERDLYLQQDVDFLDRTQSDLEARKFNIAGGEHNIEQSRLEEELGRIDWERGRVLSGAPLYSKVHAFHGRTFLRALEEFRSGPQYVNKIRFFNCDSRKIRERYQAEFEQISQAGIEMEFAPKNRFMSWIFGKETSTLDIDWIRAGLEAF